ncbi:MAG: inverse autotransporter beta domain-containing protein [Parachlamydiales bacterium]|nr:inverse autotransporter beta domain-containing protein [Parachlamydiales bacterium]
MPRFLMIFLSLTLCSSLFSDAYFDQAKKVTQTVADGTQKWVKQKLPCWAKRIHWDLNLEKTYQTSWSVKTVQPLFPKQNFFWQSQITRKPLEKTVSIGLGQRLALKHWLFGGNAFLDRRTRKESLNRLSVGFEILNPYSHFWTNFYQPLTPLLPTIEKPLQGWDLGIKLASPKIPFLSLEGKKSYWTCSNYKPKTSQQLTLALHLQRYLSLELGHKMENSVQNRFALICFTFGNRSAHSESFFDQCKVKQKQTAKVLSNHFLEKVERQNNFFTL